MDKFIISTEVFERYMDASVELFMECYAETITVNIDDKQPEDCSYQLQEKCKALIKATHRRQRFIGVLSGAKKVLKSAAVLAIAFFSLSSFLFITVEAVREPILDFYTKQKDGHMEISNLPYSTDSTLPYHNAPVITFNEQDPLGFLLPDDFFLDNTIGDFETDYSALYFNTDKTQAVTFSCSSIDGYHSIDTENCTVTELTISGDKAILSKKDNTTSVVLVWYNTKLDKLFGLSSTCFTGEELISMAEALNNTLSNN